MDEEKTKELKKISDIEITQEPQLKEEINNHPNDQSEAKKEESPKNKKKIWLIIGICSIVLVLIVIIIILIQNGKKDEPNLQTSNNKDSKFVSFLKESIKSGELDKAIKEGLNDNNIDANSVCILSMDLDSDGQEGLVVYVDADKKMILQLDTEAMISYEDSFPIDAKDSLGYVYSKEKDENYWYTEFEKNYTIISSSKKIIKEEDFLNNYFALTKTYKQKPILNHCIEYRFDKELNAQKIEKNTIKTKDLLKDNNIKQEEVKEAYNKYITEKKEQEQKAKEEAEQKAKEEQL